MQGSWIQSLVRELDPNARTKDLTGDKEDILEAEIDMESLTSFRNYFTVHRDWEDFRIL